MESFEDWYRREHPRMVATLLLATGDIELASEGVDEACARALVRWERVSAMEEPTGWAYRVALNHARRLARRRGLERLLVRRPAPEPNMPPEASEVWDLVAGLPPRQRQVVVLRHVAGLKEAEIAASLGISRSTVSSTLRDAHRRLGHLLGPFPDGYDADPREDSPREESPREESPREESPREESPREESPREESNV